MKQKVGVLILMFATILSFQNCAQKGFSPDSVGANNKLEPGSDEVGAVGDGEIEVKSEVDLQCGDVGRSIQWILRDAFVAGKSVTVPGDYKFVFKIHKNELPKTKVCAGDCGRAYKLNLHSFSGPADIEYTCRYNEAQGVFMNRIYSTIDAAEAAQHGGDDLFHELDRIFAVALRGDFKVEVSKDRKELKMLYANGDIMVFIVR